MIVINKLTKNEYLGKIFIIELVKLETGLILNT